MNIIELCLSSGLGGLELYTFRAARALEKHHNVIAILNKGTKLADHFASRASIRTLYFKRSPVFMPLLNALKLARLADNEKIDIIHMHHGKDLALVALAKFFSRSKPSIVYTRQMQITRSKNDIYHNFLYGQMDLMLTITKRLEVDARRFISRYPEKIRTLYYGVDAPDHFLTATERAEQRRDIGFSDDDFVVGLFGRLEESKGQHLLIEAIAQLEHAEPHPKALIVGHEMNAGYRETLQDLATKKDVGHSITFLDFVPDPQRLMQLCDCVVLATFEETFGLVLPEAMRAGVAVIGSDSGGVPEIISHGSTGLLFEPGNAHSLSLQIKRLYTDPELAKLLADAGKKDADTRFRTENHFTDLAHLIECARTNRPEGTK